MTIRPSSMISGVINSGYGDTTNQEPKQSMDCSVVGSKLCSCICGHTN